SHITRVSVLLLLIVPALCTFPTVAQTTGGIAGAVRDPSGAVVVGARVMVRSDATGYQRIVTTDSSGYFTVPLLPPDDYEVKVEAIGFHALTLPRVHVTVTETTLLNPFLAIGPVSENLTVTPGPQIQRDGPQLGQVVEGRVATTLPLATRNFTQIL